MAQDRKEIQKRYREKHRVQIREKNRIRMAEYRSNNKEKYTLQKQEWYLIVKNQVFVHYGNKCACCGESNMVFLSLDHINNDGASHRRRLLGTNGGSSERIYRDVRRQGFPDTYQILCHNCNRAKYVLGKCPHKEAMITK